MQNQFIAASRPHATHAAICVATGWFILTAYSALPAGAAALTNKDSVSYKIDVRAKGVATQKHELAPGKSLAGFCKAGCIIRLNEDEANDYELEGSERVSIEGGLVYYDGEEVIKATGTTSKDK